MTRFDLLLRGGLVIDGTASPDAARHADVGVLAGRLALLPPGEPAHSARTEDVTGLVVTPGFIDVHTHSDGVALIAGELGRDMVRAAVLQGVTTEICGNCGSSLFPARPERLDAMRAEARVHFGGDVGVYEGFAGFAAAHAAVPRANHLASLVGHGTLRSGVMGPVDRPATPAELDAMCALLDRALAEGAAGLSTGLIYTPGTYAGTDEVVALAAVAARHGKPYVTHLRDEMSRVEEALEEAVEIARRSGAALHVSHHKTAGRHAWGRTERTLPRIAALRAEGMDLTCDVYPYTAGSTVLAAMFPPWAADGGIAALTARLADPGERDRMRRAIAEGVPGWENTVGNGGWDRISVACAPRHPETEGSTIAELAAARGQDPLDTAADMLLAEQGEVTIISHSMVEDDVRRVLAAPYSMIASDGVPKPGGRPHPRWAGTFARVLGHYVRELGLLDLPTAVHKMTGMAADRFGLTGRGVLSDGAHADLVVLDPAAVADGATFAAPLLPPAGIHSVVVAGETVVRDGAETGARPGTVLRA
ncbi:dihydroorotase/N-acyl-D-amino-acid deacylase [Streptosporangium becharense]|uniref:Dihydroorotase/N-acyl-D-amino-acid deacylase n=1 Tax=Streptosporangium becharense TaxID=1816182 RepID=A0A7W9IMQ2_9ACTN|nr:D-aminoacylase [Streptosporangium becharense]MBB2910225.1 dihydroorotase/N-acyl-D-amino-acid deacylase [Streptosporangium becharense]MBB5822968.1 dihydroorotase/N-acyl-D-amino-acid deacylase [Streptosporangium becharense]